MGVFVDLRGGGLNLTVLNRSNDIWYGLFGANVVQFGLLQEYLASRLSAPVGVLRHFTSNAHFYTAVVAEERLTEYATDLEAHDYYAQGKVTPFSLVNTDAETWCRDLAKFFADPLQTPSNYEDDFFTHVAVPMYCAWFDRKQYGLNGLVWAEQIAAPDWRAACVEWIGRRAAKRAVTA